MKRILLSSFQLLLFLTVFSQSKTDTVHLEAIEVNTTRLEAFGIGQNLITFSAEDIKQHSANGLDDLLASQSSVFIKSYGAGSLASPSSRGTGYGHTAVLWNGFNLQSPLNGGIDFSLLPLMVADEVQLQQGGSAALFGSGAIGGVVHLRQSAPIAQGWHGNLNANAGSFGRFGQGVKLSLGRKKWSADFRVQHDQAKNDFWIKSRTDRRRQVNAALDQWAFTQHNKFQLASNQFLKTWAWLQTTDRELPPGRLQNNTHEEQRDTSIRLALEWQRFGSRAIQKIRTAWLDERFEYKSDLLAPSLSNSKTFIGEMEQECLIGNQQSLLIGANYTREQGAVPGIFLEAISRHRFSTFISYKQSFRKWQSALSFRKEWVLNATDPITGSLGLESPNWKGWSLGTQGSWNYKLPTFNDLYWTGAGARGNVDLLAERSWSQEFNLSYQVPLKKHEWSNRLTVFNLWVNDWIIWIPQGDGVWQPDNLRKVWSRGLEASTQVKFDFSTFKIQTELEYQWNRATNQKVYAGAVGALGKQLIHVPIHTLGGQLKLFFGKSQILYRHRYNGIRFASSDNADVLAAYQLGELVLSHRFCWAKKTLDLQVRVENLWNADYEVLAFRPMPTRGFFGTLKFGF